MGSQFNSSIEKSFNLTTELNMDKNGQLENTQKQVQEVVGVMRNNIDKVLERDSKLNDLDYRASNLQATSAVFQQSSKRLRKKYWWQNLKMKLILGGVSVGVIIIIVLIAYFSLHHSGGGGGGGSSNHPLKAV